MNLELVLETHFLLMVLITFWKRAIHIYIYPGRYVNASRNVNLTLTLFFKGEILSQTADIISLWQ